MTELEHLEQLLTLARAGLDSPGAHRAFIEWDEEIIRKGITERHSRSVSIDASNREYSVQQLKLTNDQYPDIVINTGKRTLSLYGTIEYRADQPPIETTDELTPPDVVNIINNIRARANMGPLPGRWLCAEADIAEPTNEETPILIVKLHYKLLGHPS